MPQTYKPVKLTLLAFNDSLFGFWGAKQIQDEKDFIFNGNAADDRDDERMSHRMRRG